MRTVRLFNDGWLFLADDAAPDQPDDDFNAVTLPHANIILPHHNFDNLEYQFVSTYRKRFRLPEARDGRRVYVDFDGAMIASTVWINGHNLGDYEGGFTPFSFDITDYVIENGENLLTVRLDSTERPDIPPFGNEVDYLTFGGIYRDVWLRYVEPCHITDVFVKPKDVLTDQPIVEFDITVQNEGVTQERAWIQVTFADDSHDYASEFQEVSLDPGTKKTLNITFQAHKTQLWSLENPVLHEYEVELRREKDDWQTRLDEEWGMFGLREAHFDKDGSFYLNGKKLKLRGLNRHQTYPYIGAAAPKRLQEKDADIIKNELGCNIVRTSHYPQSPHFLNRCDEIGLLVFEEIPGWQHIGDNDWQGISLRDVQAMIERDRNHPSIVLWGVRINESRDNTAFYTRTNELAHKLDPTRQTAGVRNFITSEFLEDVFTYNDFSNSVIDPIHTPHFVTEFNGHMFPTKTWDQEERLVEHALRHARIQDKAVGMDKVVGAIGWCAFDYNTHREFGSGDRICYHGVMDMFRLPKFAAYFYESQISPSVRPVLRAATTWTRGDRSEGGIDPLVIFSNCDEIEVFTGEELVGRYTPDRESFPSLPHAPYQIRNVMPLGQPERFKDLRLVGYVNGQAVIEQQIASDGLPHHMVLETDDSELKADGADMTRLVFKIVDKFGNRLPFTNQAVTFEINGPAELIGENPFAIMGGQAALYIKARHEPGQVTIVAKTMRLPGAITFLTIK